MLRLAALLSLALSMIAPPGPAPGYEQARAELVAALEAANSDPEAPLDRLARALNDLANYPEQLIDDPAALEQRTSATLVLARGFASVGEEQRALDTMDQALREAKDGELPIDRFGPSVRALHDQRRAAWTESGQASLEVACRVECRVYVDEHEVSNPSSLRLGPRRIIVRAIVDEIDSASWFIALNEPNQVVQLVYPEPVVIEPIEEAEPEPERAPSPMKDSGPVPLLASGGTMLAGGVVLTVLGASRWARGKVEDIDTTRSLIPTRDYRSAGITLVGIGIASLAIGVTLMSLEAVRVRKLRERNHVAIDVTPRYLGLSLSGQF